MPRISEHTQKILEDRYLWDAEKTWEDMITRVSQENAKNERNEQELWAEEFRDMMYNMYFIPAGRILRNLGKIRPSTSNCNFLPLEDSIESIFETLKYYGIISAYGGGSGINFSSLRPVGAELKTRGGNSSGMVSFMEMFNHAGERIETGGQRRAAGIALCRVSHPEVINFINAKITEERLEQFNISVIIDKSFLQAVEEDGIQELKFAGKVYDAMPARELWNMILKNMLNHAEPGLINWNNLTKNNSYYFAPIEGVNPCGELPLENFGVCNLGAIVLPHFIVNKNTNWQLMERVIKLAVRFLDNIIDLAYYPIAQQETVVKNARRIGLGTMGLADYLFKKELRYGSPEALAEIRNIYKFIREKAYIASAELAKEKGAFPKYNRTDYNRASFIRHMPPNLRLYLKANPVRNVTLLTAAPTGTTSLIPEVVGGIEPLPFKGYRRTDGVGERVYIHNLARENCTADWFVDSYDLEPEDHLDVQRMVQKYVDGGVSKTILLPKTAKEKDLSRILLEYIYDLKGVTVYRDESRKKQVYNRLSVAEIKKKLKSSKVISELDETDVECRTGVCEI